MKTKTVRNTPEDPTLPKVPITIDGKEYFLAWDFNAIARAEALTGLNLLYAIDLDGISAGQLRALLFAALQKFQPELTLEQVGAMIRTRDAKVIIPALSKAFHGSQPDPEPETKSPNAETPEPGN